MSEEPKEPEDLASELESLSNDGAEQRSPEEAAGLRRYWRINVSLMLGLLLVWAAASLGCAVLFADRLNQHFLPGTGFPLGFWFAHQGAIIVFVLVILIYCVVMNRVDDRHRRELKELNKEALEPR